MEKRVIRADEHDVERVGTVTQEVITEVFKKLGEGAGIKPEGTGPRLFFPNGIELIDVSVSVGLTAKGIEVKVKIAGEKAPKSSALESRIEDVPTGVTTG